jgi:guanyl-specific ribonuclease Sa
MQPKPPRKQTPVKGKGAANNAPQSGLAKTKRPPQPKALTAEAIVARMRTDAEAVLNAVFGKPLERDDDEAITNEVIPTVVFDRNEVKRQAVALADQVADIKAAKFKTNLTKLAEQEILVRQAMASLEAVLADSHQVTKDVERIKTLAATVGGGIKLATDPLFHELWLALHTTLAQPKPEPGPGVLLVVDPRPPVIRTFLTGLTSRLRDISVILAILDGHRPGAGAALLRRIMDDLIGPLHRGNPGITKIVPALRSGLEQEPDPSKLLALMVDADSPMEVMKLMSEAKAVKAVLLDVLRACFPIIPPGHMAATRLLQDTGLARKLLKTIADSGQDAPYFLIGAGGQSLADLRYAANQGDPVWAGRTAVAVAYGPNGQSVPFAHIRANAEALVVGQDQLPQPAPGVVRVHRYVGGMRFGNNGGAMILPCVDNTTQTTIQYLKYDVRPFTRRSERGGERVVVGSDGHQYYTADHYKTFVRIM